MTIRVAWTASSDPNILNYLIESSPDQAVWTARATVSHAIPGPNWDATRSLFYWDDTLGGTTTWYHVAAVDTLGQQSVWSPAFQATPAYEPPWDTVNNIVNDALVEIGLSAVPDVMASADPNVIQMVRLLKSAGRELVRAYNWTYLQKEYSFTTVAGVSSYSMPADFYKMIDQTWWNRTNRLPVGGPLSPQEWQYLKARLVGVVFNVLFRPIDRTLTVYPDTNTPGGYNIVFEYISRWWISNTATPDTTTSDKPTASSDYVWYDPVLATRKIKLDFLKAKGFDTTSAQQDYDTTLETVKGAFSPSAILNLNKSNLGMRDPPIGGQSVPITGFGGP